MTLRDTYVTTAYKGGWIHSNWNRVSHRTEYRVQFPDGSMRAAKSYRSAQLQLNAQSK